jgi:heat shock protein HslJ
MKPFTYIIPLLAVFLLAAASACAPTTPSLEATEWNLLKMSGNPLISGTAITLKFEKDGVNGRSGCNYFFGTLQLSGDKLTISQVGMTEMYCMDPEGIMGQEGAYLGALQNVASFRTAGEQLELLDASGAALMVFEKVVPPPPAALEGTDWSLQSFISGDAASSLIAGTTITFKLDKGNLSGNAGCNFYNAPYTLDGEKLTVGMIISSVMLCESPQGVMDQESNYRTSLSKVAGYRITGDQLELLDASGIALLVFTKVIPPPPAALEGTDWSLSAFVSGDVVSSLIADTGITLRLEDGSASGRAGCNGYGADYTLNGEKLTFGQAMSTMMFCEFPLGVMDQEANYLTALSKVAGYRISGDQLELLDAAGAVLLVYTEVAPPPPAALEGNYWSLISFVSEDAVSSLIAETAIMAKLEDGKLTGNAGCNSYSAGYTLDGEKLSFTAAISTKMYCEIPQGIMEQETAYLIALSKVARYRIIGDQLEMLDASGATLLIFHKEPPPV